MRAQETRNTLNHFSMLIPMNRSSGLIWAITIYLISGLLVSWPIVKAYLALQPIAVNINKKNVLRLLSNNEEFFTDFTKRNKELAVLVNDNSKITKVKKDR